MPYYTITPVARRGVHYNPFSGSHSLTQLPRFSAPFFRSLEDEFSQFDNFFKEIDSQVANVKAQTQPFQPRFDIKEESDKFVLHGELPGVQPQHLSIEFVDRDTMLVKGKVVREEIHGTPPAALAAQKTIEAKPQEDLTMSGAAGDAASETGSTTNYHKPSVSDDEFESVSPTSENNTATESNTNTTIATKPQQEVTEAKAQEQPQSHYWVSERSVGEFSRTFRFPFDVNQDGVTANLKDGILTVAVPKIQQQEQRRKIQVQGL